MPRMRTEDHFLLLAETPASPMHLGALQYYDRSGLAGGAFEAIRDHIVARMDRLEVLSHALRPSLFGFDADLWAPRRDFDPDYHFVRANDPAPMSPKAVRTRICDLVMQPLDLRKPPFQLHIFDNLEDPDRVAVYFRLHHSAVDGLGFQSVMAFLGGVGPNDPEAGQRAPSEAPPGPFPVVESALRFFRDRQRIRRRPKDVAEAQAQLAALDVQYPRYPTAEMKMGRGPSEVRDYATVSLPFEEVRATGKALGGTVNDIYMAIVSGALRRRLIELDDLPATPILATMPRSYRRPEHGLWGNRIITLFPHLATHLDDPLERFAEIRKSIALEMLRNGPLEVQIQEPESPFGTRRRRRLFAAMNGVVMPGNIVISNVPGPAERLSIGGMPQLTNYPVPQLASATFLNITSRRRETALDIGISTDAVKFPDADRMPDLLVESFRELQALAARRA